MIAAAGTLELAHQPPRRVEVEQVVVGQLLAVQLHGAREQVRAHADLLVVGGALVRVLAVGEVEHLLERGHEVLGEVVLALGEPARDRGVVAAVTPNASVASASRVAAERTPPVSAAPRAPRRSSRVDDHARRSRGSWRRRGSASARRCRCSRSPPPSTPRRGDRALERVEVDARPGRSARCRARSSVRGARLVAARQQPRVDLRVQRLDAPVEDLGEAGVVASTSVLDAGLAPARSRCRRSRRSRRPAPPARARSRPARACRRR